MATLVELGAGPVNESERAVVRRLVDELPHYYRVFPNVTFRDQRHGHAYEYDVVVLTGHAAYVVEVKAWRGPIRAVNRRDWQLSNGRFVRNPLPLNDQKARILKGVLEDVRLVSQGEELRAPYVQSVLVASDDARFDVFPDDDPFCVRESQLSAYIDDLSRLSFRAERDRYQGGMRKLAAAVSGQLEARTLKPRRFGSYIVTSTEAQSDDASTYLARHAEFDDGRIFKIEDHAVSHYRYSAEERERRLTAMRRSAEALHRIGDHPNVVRLREFGSTDDGFFEVTDWSDTGTLGTALALGSVDKLPVDRKLAILIGIARGLGAAHEHGVYHRNLRPDAALLAPDGTPRVCAFELAYIPDAQQTVYGADAVVDIDDNAYRAPELRDTSDYDVFSNTDLYSLGRLAYDLFLGFQPDGHTAELRADVMATPWGAALSELVGRLTQVDSSKRPGTAAEVVRELQQIHALATEQRSEGPPTSYGPEERIGDNRVIDLLARSSTSQVYRVKNEVLQEELVLKLAAPDADAEAPLREFRLLSRIHHPNVVTARWGGQLGATDGAGHPRSYLLLEWLNGETLAERLQRGPMTLEEAKTVFSSLCSALAAVHRAEVVHRDLKPENIQLTTRGPVLIDFGLATPLDSAGSEPCGTRRYQPADLSTDGWDYSVDVFALGAVAFECFAGRRPWGDAEPRAEVPPASWPADAVLPDSLRSVINDAISNDRRVRFPDGESLRQAVERATREPTTPKSVPPTAHTTPTSSTVAAHVDRVVPWSAEWIEVMAQTLSPSHLLFESLWELTTPSDSLALDHLLAIEKHAADIERPLGVTFPSLYDELLTECHPLSHATLPEEAAPLSLLPDETLVVIDGMTFADWSYVRHICGERLVTTWMWRTGPVAPDSRPKRLGSLARAFCSPPEPVPGGTPGELGRAIHNGARCARLDLPLGRRDDALEELLVERKTALDTVLAPALQTKKPIAVTTTLGATYLGHGLREDVGADQGARGDRVRRAWQSTFGIRRWSSDAPPSSANAQPHRSSNGLVFVAGRTAWPEPADSPRFAVGGASLPERLLPLLRVSGGPASS
ncbi:MAG: protein kinase [Sandaracinaceae bacterium]|nr:protein kinase [Sandaracinaceae bacterium]